MSEKTWVRPHVVWGRWSWYHADVNNTFEYARGEAYFDIKDRRWVPFTAAEYDGKWLTLRYALWPGRYLRLEYRYAQSEKLVNTIIAKLVDVRPAGPDEPEMWHEDVIASGVWQFNPDGAPTNPIIADFYRFTSTCWGYIRLNFDKQYREQDLKELLDALTLGWEPEVAPTPEAGDP